jgi:hypothetical protein
MKSFTLNFGKTFFLGLSVLIALSLSSCRSDEEDELGYQTLIEWKSQDYLTTQVGKQDYYVVSSQGDNYMFVAKNSNSFWLGQIEYEIEDSIQYITGFRENGLYWTDDTCDVSVAGNIIEVNIKPNADQQRMIRVLVRCGNTVGTLNFIQLGRQE